MTQKDLPKKEATIFKNILKMYEYKQYKQGIKSCDLILKKFPEHGETLTLKGLFTVNLDKREEGFELAKKGISKSVTSAVSWNVYGIMHRSDKNYLEALKAFQQALKLEKENFAIFRDVCMLHVHLRNYELFNETSLQILELRPTSRTFWAGLAASYDLLDKPDMAVKVLDAYEDTFNQSRQPTSYEHSELLMYRLELIIKTGNWQEALANCEKIYSTVFDRTQIQFLKATILKNLNKVEEAALMFKELVQINPDSLEFIKGLLSCDDLNKDDLSRADLERLRIILSDLKRDNPKSNLLKYLPLKYLDGKHFEQAAREYLEANIRKGVPSLFSNIKNLYINKEKRDTVLEIVNSFYSDLQSIGTFYSDAEPALPTAQLWTLYYLAQHHDKVGDFQLALEYIQKAIDHTPTMVELFMTKARIFKHMGELQQAMDIMNEARELDLQDRHVNSKCTKYMLRNNQIPLAEQTISLFVRPECIDKVGELYESQCLWFIIECAHAYFRMGNLAMALKKSHDIIKLFAEFEDDQFDFHSYCMRRITVRPYIKTLKFEDELYSNKIYVQAAQLATQCYLKLAESPAANPNATSEKLSAADKKKLKQKQKKLLAKPKDEDNQKTNSEKKDLDPLGLKLLEEPKPLEKANQLLQKSIDSGKQLPTAFYDLSFQVCIQLGNLVQATKSLTFLYSSPKFAEYKNTLQEKVEFLSKEGKVTEGTAKYLKEFVEKMDITNLTKSLKEMRV